MDWIVWDHTLQTGHPQLDADHAEFARLFNLLPEALQMPNRKAMCSKLLEQIIEHTRTHFELEQKLMQERCYPKIRQHSAEHAMLLDQAHQYRTAFDAGATEPEIALIDFPDVWLSFHILFSDKDLARVLAQAD